MRAIASQSSLRWLLARRRCCGMRDCAARLGLGQDLSLVPAFSDPKDLFGLIDPLAAQTADRRKARQLASHDEPALV